MGCPYPSPIPLGEALVLTWHCQTLSDTAKSCQTNSKKSAKAPVEKHDPTDTIPFRTGSKEMCAVVISWA